MGVCKTKKREIEPFKKTLLRTRVIIIRGIGIVRRIRVWRMLMIIIITTVLMMHGEGLDTGMYRIRRIG